MPSKPHVHILGLGNIARYLAFELLSTISKPGISPRNLHPPRLTLLTHRPEDVAAFEKRALRSIWCHVLHDEAEGEFQVMGRTHPKGEISVQFVGDESAKGEMITYLVVATKAHQTIEALRAVRDRIGRSARVLFLQNGMGIPSLVSAILFPDPSTRPTYLAGVCTAGIKPTVPPYPFSFHLAGQGDLIFGIVPDPDDPLPRSRTPSFLEEHLPRLPHLNASLVSPQELLKAQLRKLIVNATINPLTALLRCRNGEVFGTPARKMVLEALVAEAGPVIRSLLEGSGIRKAEIENEFSDEELRNAAVKVAEATAANESSMLQDVKQKRETEVRWINGWVVEEGKKRGMECRWHEEVVSLVENRGQGERRLLGEVLEGRGNDD